MDSKQRLQTARLLLSRSLGVIEFTNEEMANGKSEFMSNLCLEIREFLEPSTPTLDSAKANFCSAECLDKSKQEGEPWITVKD